jgi:hypothetical protein
MAERFAGNWLAVGKKLVRIVLAAAIVGSLTSWATAAGLPDQTVPQSFGVQMKGTDLSAEKIDATLDAVKALGLKYVRRGFYWEAHEKEVGTYDFTESDRFVKACKDRGLSIVGGIVFSHKKYGPAYEEKGRSGYARFAAALAEHFKGEPILWELWNEPNVSTFWTKHGAGHNSEQYADEYLALVKATVPGMKQADPSCFVMGGSVSGLWSASYQWQEFCFRKGMLSTGIDAWSVHPYSTKNPEDYVEAYDKVREMMTEYGGKTLPILNTERGYPIQTKEGFSGGDPKLLEQYQAWHLVRQYLVDQLCGIKLTSWYEWSGNESFGLMKNGAPMPAYNACKVLIEQLGGYHFDMRLNLESKRDFLLRYVNKEGAVKLVAWTSPPEGQSPDATRRRIVEFQVKGAGDVEFAQLYGEKQKIHVDGKPLEITLSGAPQYVSLPSGLTVGALVSTREIKETKVAAQAKEPGEKADPLAAAQTDLKLFEKDAAWKFVKNTGDGSFALGSDASKPIGIFNYSFAKKIGKNTPYVLAHVDTSIPETAGQFQMNVRSSKAHRLTLRFVDSTGQTLQVKGSVKGDGSWEPITIPLSKKMEHWDGANDGKVHFPIKSFVISIPQQGEDDKEGKLEFADAVFLAK